MHKMLLVISVLIPIYVFPQCGAEDVIYLKSGSIIRGKVMPGKPLPASGEMALIGEQGKVYVEIQGGSVFVFQQSEIDSIKSENLLKKSIREIKHNYFRRNRGYKNMTELGIIYGMNLKKEASSLNYNYSNLPEDDFGLSLHSVNGYQIWPYLYAGAGIGIDRLITYKQTFSPFYLRISSEFLKRKVTPYVFCDLGYSHMWKTKSDQNYSYRNKGGLYVSCGGGVRIYTRGRASVILSLAYKRNNSETKWWYTQGTDGTYYTITRTYQRMVMNIGVAF